jgi:hypothetical protein
MPVPLFMAAAGALGKAAGSALKLGIGAGQNTQRSPSFGESKQYDPNASNYGGQPGGRAAYTAQMDARRQGIEGRGAFQANYQQADADRRRGLQARGQQGEAAQLMMNRATGATPSIAQMQADRQMGQMQAQQAAQAASARGAGGLALAQQNAANNVANAAGAISNQAQINAANERMQAEQNAFGAFSTMRGGDLSSQGQAANQAQFQAQMQQTNRDANDARAMGYEQLGARANEAELNAKMQQQGQLAGSYTANQGYEANRNQANANRSGKLWDELLPSDANAKVPMFLSDFTGKLGLGGSGVGGGTDMGGKGSIDGSDVQQASSGTASSAGMPGMVGGGGITGGNMGSLGMPQGGGMSSGGFLGFFSDTAAKRAAVLAEGRRQGAAMAGHGKGPDPADVDYIRNGAGRGATLTEDMLDDRERQNNFGRGDAGDTIGKPALDEAIGQRVAADRQPTQREQDNAIEAQKIRQNMGQDPATAQWQKSFGDPNAASAGARDNPQGKTPWWMTPVDKDAFSFFSDKEAKSPVSKQQLAGGRDPQTFKRDTPADQKRVKRKYEDDAGKEADAMIAAYRRSENDGPTVKVEREQDQRLAMNDPPSWLRDYMVSDERAKRAAFEQGAAYATKSITGEDMQPWTPENKEAAEAEFDQRREPAPHPHPLPDPPPPPMERPGMKVEIGPAQMERPERRLQSFERDNPIAEANRSMVGSAYAYKPGLTPSSQKPGEPNFGPMAQNLETSPIAGTAVKQDPATGLKVIDRDKALKVVMAGVADLQRQQDATRASMQSMSLSKGGRKRK